MKKLLLLFFFFTFGTYQVSASCDSNTQVNTTSNYSITYSSLPRFYVYDNSCSVISSVDIAFNYGFNTFNKIITDTYDFYLGSNGNYRIAIVLDHTTGLIQNIYYYYYNYNQIFSVSSNIYYNYNGNDLYIKMGTFNGYETQDLYINTSGSGSFTYGDYSSISYTDIFSTDLDFTAPVGPYDFCYYAPDIYNFFPGTFDIVDKQILNNYNTYNFSSSLDDTKMSLTFYENYDFYSTGTIISTLSSSGFISTFFPMHDSRFKLDLPISDKHYYIYMYDNNVEYLQCGDVNYYVNDDIAGFFDLPGNVESCYIISAKFNPSIETPRTSGFDIVQYDNVGDYICLIVDNDSILNQLNDLKYARDNGTISEGDYQNQIDKLIIDNDLNGIISDTGTGTLSFTGVTVDMGFLGKYFNFKQFFGNNALNQTKDLLTYNSIPTYTSSGVFITIPIVSFNSNFKFVYSTGSTFVPFIIDDNIDNDISDIDPNNLVVGFLGILFGLFLVMLNFGFLVIVLSPIIFLKYVLTHVASFLDLKQSGFGNIVSLPSYISYILAFFIVVASYFVILFSLYDFTHLVYSWIYKIMLFVSGSFGNIDIMLLTIGWFYSGISILFITYISYLLFNKFGRVN